MILSIPKDVLKEHCLKLCTNGELLTIGQTCRRFATLVKEIVIERLGAIPGGLTLGNWVFRHAPVIHTWEQLYFGFEKALRSLQQMTCLTIHLSPHNLESIDERVVLFVNLPRYSMEEGYLIKAMRYQLGKELTAQLEPVETHYGAFNGVTFSFEKNKLPKDVMARVAQINRQVVPAQEPFPARLFRRVLRLLAG